MLRGLGAAAKCAPQLHRNNPLSFMSIRLAVVLKGYPRLSETFIAQELLALERHGYRLEIWSLRRPTDQATHPVHARIQARLHYLPEYLHNEPYRVLRGAVNALRLPGCRRALRVWLRDWLRDPTRNRLRRFGQALVFAAELSPAVDYLYVHFLHTPASVTRYAAYLLNRRWAAAAHARDIWTLADWEKREKLADLDWLVTCTAANVAHLRALAPDPARVHLAYHGLAADRAPTHAPRRAERDGGSAAAPVRLLSVGRCVAKKGFDLLLQALARLPADRHWRWTHIGGGPLRRPLAAQAAALGIADRIKWRGALAFDHVLAEYRQADVFILPSRIDADGDRDGLPNVLMEAQAQGVVCLATTLSGIPELIRDGETGRLVAPEDCNALAAALLELIRSPPMRDRLAQAAEQRVRTVFGMERGIATLIGLLPKVG